MFRCQVLFYLHRTNLFDLPLVFSDGHGAKAKSILHHEDEHIVNDKLVSIVLRSEKFQWCTV